MLSGQLVGLRARLEPDVPILHTGLYDDVETRIIADNRPWRPLAPGPASPFRLREDDDGQSVPFSVVELSTGELSGAAVLWNIDNHNRSAHLGLTLLRTARGRGLGLDVVRVLCRYGFQLRGLHRLQIETLASNEPMRRAAVTAGFTHEGTLRQAGWTAGEFLDEAIYGLLAAEWQAG